jgi:hypothetical protein
MSILRKLFKCYNEHLVVVINTLNFVPRFTVQQLEYCEVVAGCF